MGSKTKNVSSTKETMKEIVLAINHLSQELENLTMRVRQMDESMFGGLIRSEAMINVLLRKELVEGPDFNESLEEIYNKVEENSKQIIKEFEEKNDECTTEIVVDGESSKAEVTE